MTSRAKRAGLAVVFGAVRRRVGPSRAGAGPGLHDHLGRSTSAISGSTSHVNDPGAGDDIYNWSDLDGNGDRWPNDTDHACFPGGAVATTDQVDANTPSVSSFTISAGATLSVTHDPGASPARTPFNAGTLNMAGPVPLTISDANSGDGGEGLTNTATGTINFPSQGAANGQLAIIVGELFTNQVTVNVNDPEASIQRAGRRVLSRRRSLESGVRSTSPLGTRCGAINVQLRQRPA